MVLVHTNGSGKDLEGFKGILTFFKKITFWVMWHPHDTFGGKGAMPICYEEDFLGHGKFHFLGRQWEPHLHFLRSHGPL